MVRPVDFEARFVRLVLLLIVGIVSTANADFTFGTPSNLGPNVNSSSGEGSPSISSDGLSLFFGSLRSGGADIWVTTRATTEDDWTVPQNLGAAVNSSAWDSELSISSDGLELIFASDRPGGSGGSDLWVTRRDTTSGPWKQAVNLGATVNTPADDMDACISTDGLSLYIESLRTGGSGGSDMWLARRASVLDPWREPANLGPVVNSPANDGAPGISADGRVLFFSDHGSPRAGGHGGSDMWIARRATVSDPWGEPVNLGPALNGSAEDQGPSISADGSTLYFFSTRPGGFGDFDLWQVSIVPVVDFNGDGSVDGADVCILADRWGTDDSLCDIGPLAWGDGIVDLEDLKVLARHIGEEVIDGTLIAHWAFDETDGDVACDSGNTHDGTLLGHPVWRPEDGTVAGALGFDGVDDCVVVDDAVVDPADGPFSVLAWVQGGAPGQAIVSQQEGVDWLAADASAGVLSTGLQGSRRGAGPLVSGTVITDGLWHRVAFVWDGAYRSLYVDGTLVAEDEQGSLTECSGGLNIGCGKDMAPGSFFSGLIDDVRLYNRAVQP